MLKRSAVVAALWVGVLFTSVAHADDWPVFRGPLGSGVSRDALPEGGGPLGVAMRWKVPIGSGYAGIAVAGDIVVTAFTAGERDVVAAFDRESGEERWRFDLAPYYKGHDGSHDGPIATPAIADGRVFALGCFGHLAAIDAASGRELWRKNLVDDLGCEKPMYGFGGSPIVAGSRVIVQTGGEPGSVTAFDAATGEVRWRAFDDEAWLQSPIVTEIGGRPQLVVMGNTSVVGIDTVEGAVIWRHRHGGAPAAMGALSSSPLPLGGDRLLLKHDRRDSRVVQLIAGDEGTTAEVVDEGRFLAGSYSPPTTSGGTIYGYTNRFLSAFDPEEGELLWKSRDPGDGFLVAIEDQLVVLTKKGTLHVGPASPEGWTETTSAEVFDELAWTPPAVADGALYLRSLNELARVDFVRGASEADLAAASAPEMPALLASLAKRIADAGVQGTEASKVIDAFLADRELPLVDGEEVIFLWRGEAEDVAIAGDRIGMRREEPMQRLAGTDLWWWSSTLDPRDCVSYVFFVDYVPRVDPTHSRSTTATVLGPDMNWLRGETLDMSWFAMKDWPGHEAAKAASKVAPGARGRIEEMMVSVDPNDPNAPEDTPKRPAMRVPVHVWLPPGYDEDESKRYATVYVHNAAAREAGDWPATLDRVVGRTVEPLIVVFLGRGAASPTFATTVVPAIDEKFRTRKDRDARANIGMAWDSAPAAAITFANSDTFGRLGIQSFYGLDGQMQMWLEQLGDQTAEDTPMKIYLEWGRWDLRSPHEAFDMRDSSRKAWEILVDRSYKPMGGEVWDSTDFVSWRNRTDVMLEALFPIDPDAKPARLGAWRTGRP